MVRPDPLPPAGPSVHGIDNGELEHGPSFPIAFARLATFLDYIVNAAICERSDSSQEDVDMLPMMLYETPRVVLVAHNGIKFDFPFLLSECMRQEVPVAVFADWRYIDTLHLLRAIDSGIHGGCIKLQCLLRVVGDDGRLRAHRATAP